MTQPVASPSSALLQSLGASTPAATGSATTASSATAAAAAEIGGSTDSAQELSQRFLTLLVAQMKNQDPLNPTDNSQITSQIAQINTVTGINSLNDTLNKITGQINTTQRLQASALIGHQVLVPGNEIKVGSDGTATSFGVDLKQPAANLKVTITDDAGHVVHQSVYHDQSAGIQSFTWDGKDATDTQVGPGKYELSVTATDVNGDPVAATPLDTGYVGGVVSGDNGPELDLGPGGLVSLDSVYRIL